MPIQCRVLNCKSKGSSGFHAFPANKAVRQQWIRLAKCFQWEEKINADTNSFYRVCKNHFKDSDYVNGRLLPNSLPSRFLPDHDDHCYRWVQVSKPKPVKRLVKCPEKQSSLNKRFNSAQLESVVVTNYRETTTYNRQLSFHETVPIESENHSQENKLNRSDVNLMKRNNVGPKLKTTKPSAQARKIRYLKNQLMLLRLKRKEEKWTDGNVVKYLDKRFNKQQSDLFAMQIRNYGKKRKGYRYTPAEKNLSLAMYKQSPKKYRFLKKFLVLPSKRTLGRHSANLIFETGINVKLFEYIKERVKDLDEIDKNCVLVWDEIGLKAHLDYSQSRDLIDGFVDLEDIRRPTFATHSLAFMIRGINTPYKQTVTYYNTDNLKGFELAGLVIRTTEAVLDTGLRVIGSVSDQVGSNIKAIKHLMGVEKFIDGQLLSYKIRCKTIFHCWDIPHLLKGVRNNLLTKNLTHFILKRWEIDDTNFFDNICKEERVASWDDVSILFDYTSKSSERSQITDDHINPVKYKMKVSLATQIFSDTYGSLMLRCSEQDQLPHDCSSTAQILLFFNDLFDSLNGSRMLLNDELKSAVTQNSHHFAFWEYALSALSLMNFVDKENGKITNRTKVLLNFASTIRGYMEISRLMLNEGMTEVAIRNTNQDGLENNFGIVRSCCQASVAPIAIHYRSAHATITVNNLSSVNSISSNCEVDTGVPLLSNVHEFLLNEKPKNEEICSVDVVCSEEEAMLDSIVFNSRFSNDELSSIEREDMSYIASLICKKLLQGTKCQRCTNSLQSNSKVTDFEKEGSLKYPSENFMIQFEKVMISTNQIIPYLCSEKKLKMKILSCIDKIINDDLHLGCSKHSLHITKAFKEYIIIHEINKFCKNINNYLSGKITKLPDKSNCIQELAQSFRAKKKHVVKHSDIFTADNQNIDRIVKKDEFKKTTNKITKKTSKKAVTKKIIFVKKQMIK